MDLLWHLLSALPVLLLGLGLYLLGRYRERRRWQGDIHNRPKPPAPPQEYKGLEGMLSEWLGDIDRDPRFSREILLEHIIHHVEEGKREGISESWQASMTNLIQLVCVKAGILYEPRTQKRLERLYEHWRNDPQNMTPPPQMKSFAKVAELERQAKEPKRYVAAEPS